MFKSTYIAQSMLA